MIYNPPEKWTEIELLGLSGEDDRYEFKSGQILIDEKTKQHKLDDKLCLELATEICAFANSFGGTLFLGVNNKKKIDGVSKFYKGKQSNPFKEWLDQKITHFLEFRLPNYRVTEVGQLSEETIHLLGNDKTIIAIDIFDSDLAPHQCKYDHKYYYRQSSNSNPAPHHYLSYLWSRTNSNMANVVNTWFRFYLNHLIEWVTKINQEFKSLDFNTQDFPLGYTHIHIRKIIFLQGGANSWNSFNSSLTAKQFLRTYPEFDKKIKELTVHIESFFNNFTELENIVENSPDFERRIREMLYEDLLKKQISDLDQLVNQSFEQILANFAGNVFESSLSGISNFPTELKKALSTMTIYNLLGLEVFPESSYSFLFSFSRDQLVGYFSESLSLINTKIRNIKKLMNKISETAKVIAIESEELRYALALKHNTTYE